MNNATHDILLFDGICNLCNSLVRFIIKRDKKGRFKFASLQSETGQLWLRHFGIEENEFDSLVYIQENKYYIKSTAALKMFLELGGAWKMMYVFIVVPRPLRNFLYDMIAKSRYKVFGKRDSCMVPTPELEARFLP